MSVIVIRPRHSRNSLGRQQRHNRTDRKLRARHGGRERSDLLGQGEKIGLVGTTNASGRC
jgi:hypothetical protein